MIKSYLLDLFKKSSLIKINFDNIIYLCIFFMCFIKFPQFSFYNYVKYSLILVCGIYLLLNIKELFKNKSMLLINFLIIFLAGWSICTSYINQGFTERNPFLASLVYYGAIVEAIFVLELAFIKKKIHNFLIIFLMLYFTTICILDLYIFVERFILGGEREIYIIGNKFFITYFHFQFIILYWTYFGFIKKFDVKYSVCLLVLLFILVSFILSCSSSVFIGFLILFFVYFKTKLFKIVKSPLFILLLYFFSVTFIFWYEHILNNQILIYISNALNENIENLSGRTNIYDIMPNIIYERLFFGYGYGSSYELTMLHAGAADVQNGFWDIALMIGVPGALLYSVVIIYPWFSKKQISMTTYPLCVYVVSMLLLSFIEITFTDTLLFFCCLIIFLEKYKNGLTRRYNNEYWDIINAKNY